MLSEINRPYPVFQFEKWFAVQARGPIIDIRVLRGLDLLDMPEYHGTKRGYSELIALAPGSDGWVRACEQYEVKISVKWTVPWTVEINGESFLARLLRKKSTWSLLGWLLHYGTGTAIGITGARLVVHCTKEKAGLRTYLVSLILLTLLSLSVGHRLIFTAYSSRLKKNAQHIARYAVRSTQRTH